MKEQQTYPIEWKLNREANGEDAFCNEREIGSYIHDDDDHDCLIAYDTGNYRIGLNRTVKLAKTAVEDAFRSFIRDVTKQGGDK